MLNKIPASKELTALLGQPMYEIWTALCTAVEQKYEMECFWDNGGKAWTYECKYRRGGKTLCSLYARPQSVGILIIFGKYEREKFEQKRISFSETVQKVYDKSATYHDGKWMMFILEDTSLFSDLMKLLEIKRKPNRRT